MKTCNDCSNFERCNKFVGAEPAWSECDWFPSRYKIDWISCNKRLPKNDERVLVLYDTPCLEDCVTVCFLYNDLWWIDADPNHALDRNLEVPKYWMPLPELPTDTDRLVLTKDETSTKNVEAICFTNEHHWTPSATHEDEEA